MLLSDSTFSKLSAASVERDVGGVKIRVPSVQNLIALKVHALNHTRTRRFLKDFQDVIELVLRNKIDLAEPDIRDIFSRYGTDDLYEKVRRACHTDGGR